tara:strand:+ start:19023 stop:19736 length:714 start_codon:yes stop_codon:yes gene_type:complete
MSPAEMKELFLILYDKITNLAAPGYEDTEIVTFLNKAQLQFVKHRYNSKGNKYREGVESTEKRRKDLSELHRNAELAGGTSNTSGQIGTLPNGEFFDLPDEFLYTLMEEVIINDTDDCFNGNRIKVKPITHDEYNAYINNPWKKPDETMAWRLDFSQDPLGAQEIRHEIIVGENISVRSYIIRYVKSPRDIDIINNISSELHDSVHEEIVDRAVTIATGITDPQSYQIRKTEEQVTE